MLYHNLGALIALAVATVIVAGQSHNEAPRPRRSDRWDDDESEPVTRGPVAKRAPLIWAAGLLVAGLVLLATVTNAAASGLCGGY